MKSIIKIPSKELPYFPGVDFNFEQEKCVLYEESYMEESYTFYKPLLEWLKEYFTLKNNLEFNFKFTYFNTSTSKMIIELLELLKKNELTGKNIIINWYVPEDDPDMIVEISDFEIDTDMKINIIILKQ